MGAHFFGLKDWVFSYSHSVGRREFAATGFRNPVDLAPGADDIVYVLNRSTEFRKDGVRVTICTLDERYIGEFSSYGDGDGQMVWPTSVALDQDGKVYVSDEWLNRITVFNKDGEYVSKWGGAGSGKGELGGPAGLAISRDGTLLLTDSRNHRVQKFTLDGDYLGQFGAFGSGPGQLNMPWGIALDNAGLVYVADWRNDRIQQFTPEGEWQATFGTSGKGVGEFNRPCAVCVDQDGDIYVADWLNNRIQILAPDGRFRAELRGEHVLSPWGKTKLLSNPDMILQRHLAMAHDRGAFEKSFKHPSGVKIDQRNRIAALDHYGCVIQVYQKQKMPVVA